MTRHCNLGFMVCIPARFFQDPSVSADAKALLGLIKSFADGKTGLTFVRPRKLDQILHWGRRRRERAQRELCVKGWIRTGWKRGLGKWAMRTYVVCDPRAVAPFQRSGETAQLISYHSQSHVRSGTTVQNKTKKEPEMTSPPGLT